MADDVVKRLFAWLRTYRLRLVLLFLGVIIPLLLFGWLASEVLEQEPFPFDEPILLFFYQHATPLYDQIMVGFSLLGYQFGLIPFDLAVFALLLYWRRWGDSFFWFMGVGGSAILNLVAKQFFGRIRPDLWLSIAPETTLSFPSGHAMGTMSCLTALAVLTWPSKWRWLVLLIGGPFVFLVGLSRVYLGVHYPSDILAGWAAACAWVVGVSLVLYGRSAKPTEQAEPETLVTSRNS